MKQLLGILVLGLLLHGCASGTPVQYNLKDDRIFYNWAFMELWHGENTIRKIGYNLMPASSRYFTVSHPFKNSRGSKVGAGPNYFGFSENDMETSVNRSLEFCREALRHTNYLTLTGFKPADPNNCIAVMSFDNLEPKKSEDQVRAELAALEKKRFEERYIGRCENLGFKRNSEDMNKCINELYNTEVKINKKIESDRNRINGKDVLLALLALDSAIQLMSPPKVTYRNTNCFIDTVKMSGTGGLGAITCN